MGIFAGAKVAETRIYDDPSNPELSTYQVSLPITALEAVLDSHTGDNLREILARITNPNILVNGDFRKPVNTRGLLEYSGSAGTITIDRWALLSAGTRVAVVDGGVKISRVNSTALSIFRQAIGNPNLYRGKTLTVSADIISADIDNGGVRFCIRYAFPGGAVQYFRAPANNQLGLREYTFTVPEQELDYLYIDLEFSSNIADGTYEVSVSRMKLELGPISTLANDPPANFEEQFLLSTGASSTQSNENILHNSDFRNPVSQLGQSSYTQQGYTIDRWRRSSATANPGELSFTPEGVKFVNNASVNLLYRQDIENPSQYAGKTVTISADIASTLRQEPGNSLAFSLRLQGESENILINVHFQDDSNGIRSGTVTIPSNISNVERLEFVFTTYPNSETIVRRAKLELGTVSTLANDPPGTEVDNPAIYRFQRVYSTDDIDTQGQTSPPMRITPVIMQLTSGANAGMYLYDANL